MENENFAHAWERGNPFRKGGLLYGLVIKGVATRKRCPPRARPLWEWMSRFEGSVYYGALPSGRWACVLHTSEGFAIAVEWEISQDSYQEASSEPSVLKPIEAQKPSAPRRKTPPMASGVVYVSPWDMGELLRLLEDASSR